MYEVLKAIHVVGVVILLGNVTITAFWKVFADLTNDPRIVAHAQRGVTITEWMFTLGGIALILIGGYGAVAVAELPLFTMRWLALGQALFGVSGIIWLAVLVPLQIRQAAAARRFESGGAIPERYRHDARKWLLWGIIATIPLVAAIVVMVLKP